jgi:hypothetical protein
MSLICELVNSQLMALGLLIATSGTGSGFLLVNLYFLCEFWAINELDCEHVSPQLVALGLHTATAGTGSGFLDINFVFYTWILSCQSACF